MPIASKDDLKQDTQPLKPATEEAFKAYSKVRDSKLETALAAACALVAFADSKLAEKESGVFSNILKTNSHLRTEGGQGAVDTKFNEFTMYFQASQEEGEHRAMDALEPLRKDRLKATAVLRACFAMVVSDGVFSDAEKDMMKKICVFLDQDPATYGLS